MITVRMLKDFIEHFSDETMLYAYEGEDIGISFDNGAWIRTRETGLDTFMVHPTKPIR